MLLKSFDYLTEWSVICTGISSSLLLPDIMDLNADDFYDADNRIIFEVMKNLYVKDKTISIITVRDALTKLNKINLADKIISDFDEKYFLFSYSIKSAIEVIREFSNKRKIWCVCQDCIDEMKNYNISSSDAILNIEKRFHEITSNNSTQYRTFGDSSLSLDRFVISGDHVKSGLRILDRMIMGFFGTQFIILASRPKQGKSSMALNIARNAAKDGDVIFFSLEMSKEELEQRLLVSESEIELIKILKCNLQLKEIEKLEKCQRNLFEEIGSNLKIFDSILDLHKISNECKKLYDKKKTKLIIIDYIQLVRVNDIKERRLQVEEVSRTCKQLAIKLKVPIIGISQLSRISDDEEPKLYHLRESGSLEQDANLVMFIWFDKKKLKNYIIIAANRQGPVGKLQVDYRRRFFKFYDMEDNDLYIPSEKEVEPFLGF